jgi:NAD/NADP transhydrogenase alpha subunit
MEPYSSQQRTTTNTDRASRVLALGFGVLVLAIIGITYYDTIIVRSFDIIDDVTEAD